MASWFRGEDPIPIPQTVMQSAQIAQTITKKCHPEARLPRAYFAKGAVCEPKDLNVKFQLEVNVEILRPSSPDGLRMTASGFLV
jgi:hypothetical protein